MQAEQENKMLSEILSVIKGISLNGRGVKAPSKKSRRERIKLMFTREAIKEEMKIMEPANKP